MENRRGDGKNGLALKSHRRILKRAVKLRNVALEQVMVAVGMRRVGTFSIVAVDPKKIVGPYTQTIGLQQSICF